MIDLIKGNCLIESEKIESGSVDLILTDLPYGTVKGMGGDMEKYKHLSNADWDNVIDTNKIMQIANRILRKNGKMVLTANQPFTTELISKAIPNVPHCYNMYWDKMHFANCLIVNKAPVSYIEDVLVFSKNSEAIPGCDKELNHPLRYYAEEVLKHIKLTKKEILSIMGQSGYHFLFRINSSQFRLPPKETYYKMANELGFLNAGFFKEWDILKSKENDFKLSKESERLDYLKKHNQKYPSTFNLWEGNKYKSNILKYKKDYDGHHPTQKPVLLLEDLIKTFSNENDLVVDLTMGSGSTGVACVNTNRNFIGIELDDNYFKIAQGRIKQTLGVRV
jgi:DNA modification methylase